MQILVHGGGVANMAVMKRTQDIYQGREIRVPVPGPPENVFGGKVTGTNDFAYFSRNRPGKPNQRKGQNEKFMNFTHFCEFWYCSLGKQARFTH